MEDKLGAKIEWACHVAYAHREGNFPVLRSGIVHKLHENHVEIVSDQTGRIIERHPKQLIRILDDVVEPSMEGVAEEVMADEADREFKEEFLVDPSLMYRAGTDADE